MSSDKDPSPGRNRSYMGLLQLCAKASENPQNSEEQPSSQTTEEEQPSSQTTEEEQPSSQTTEEYQPSSQASCTTITISSTPGTIVISSSAVSQASQQSHNTDEPDKDWLENVLEDVFQSPVEVMKEHIKALKSDIDEITSCGLVVPQELYERVQINLAALEEFTDVIDNANDFFNIGGFTIIDPLLKMPDNGVKVKVLGLIGDLVQNNKFCQDEAVKAGLLPELFFMLDSEDELVSCKALYAISCLCRQKESLLTKIAEVDGFSKFLRTLQKPSDRLRTKCAFLLTHFIKEMPECRDLLYDMGIVQLLVCLLQDEVQPSTEYLLSCLLELVAYHRNSKNEVMKPELQLQSTITALSKAVKDAPEYREIQEHLIELSKYCVIDLTDEEITLEETER